MLNKQFLLNIDGSYPNGMTEKQVTSLGLIPVLPSSQPTVVPQYHRVVEADAILINGEYVQQWKLEKFSDQEIAKIEEDIKKILTDLSSNQV